MKNNILYFLLGIMFIVTISATNKKEIKETYNGTFIDSGSGYKLYKHRVNGTWVYVAKSTDSYPVSITTP